MKRLTKVLFLLGFIIGLNLLFKLSHVFQGQLETRELVSIGFSSVAMIVLVLALKDSASKKISGK